LLRRPHPLPPLFPYTTLFRSSVYRQPETESERYQAYQALLACPVGSIGALVPDKAVMRAATDSFPMLIENNVCYNGFNSEKSFGDRKSTRLNSSHGSISYAVF